MASFLYGPDYGPKSGTRFGAQSGKQCEALLVRYFLPLKEDHDDPAVARSAKIAICVRAAPRWRGVLKEHIFGMAGTVGPRMHLPANTHLCADRTSHGALPATRMEKIRVFGFGQRASRAYGASSRSCSGPNSSSGSVLLLVLVRLDNI